jgi:hypothetical protein
MSKPGPKELQLRAMREAMVKRDQKLPKSKMKMKAVGQVVKVKASKRGG